MITEEPLIPVNVEWQKKYRKARVLINLFRDDSQTVHAKNLTSACDICNTLKTIYE